MRKHMWMILSLAIIVLLTVSCSIDLNKKPDIPSNPYPEDRATGIPLDVELSWECSDPDGDPLIYDLYLGTDSNPSLVARDLEKSRYKPKALDEGKTYYWKVVARDLKGSMTEGPLWKFTTTRAPNKPSNPYPRNDSRNVSLNISLSWECSDPDGDPLKYDIYFGTDPNPPLVKEDLAELRYNPGSLSYETTYYWKVVAKDGKGGVTEGPVWKFTTRGNTPPNTPTNPTPKNGAKNVPIDTKLSWECSDPDGDPLKYDVYLGTNPNPPLVFKDLDENKYDPMTLDKNKTYYWKIVAKDGGGGVREGPVWKFTTAFIYDDFEKYTVGSEPNPPWGYYYTSSPDEAYAVISNSGNPGKSLKFVDLTDEAFTVVYAYPNSFKSGILEVDMRIDDPDGAFGIRFWNENVSSWEDIGPYVGIGYFDGKLYIFAYDEVYTQDFVKLREIEIGRWYRIKIVFDLNKGKNYDVYIDGDYEGTGYSGTDSVGLLTLVAFSDAKCSAGYFDNLKLTVLDPGYIPGLNSEKFISSKELINRQWKDQKNSELKQQQR